MKTTDWNKMYLIFLKANFDQERKQTLRNKVEPVFAPLVDFKFVDGNAELCDSKRPRQDGMILRLSILKCTLEFALCGVNDQNGALSLTGSRDHGCDEVSVTRAVDDGEIPAVGGKVCLSVINCNSVGPFFLILIHDISVLKSSF